jgi:hypothetical protein
VGAAKWVSEGSKTKDSPAKCEPVVTSSQVGLAGQTFPFNLMYFTRERFHLCFYCYINFEIETLD